MLLKPEIHKPDLFKAATADHGYAIIWTCQGFRSDGSGILPKNIKARFKGIEESYGAFEYRRISGKTVQTTLEYAYAKQGYIHRLILAPVVPIATCNTNMSWKNSPSLNLISETLAELARNYSLYSYIYLTFPRHPFQFHPKRSRAKIEPASLEWEDVNAVWELLNKYLTGDRFILIGRTPSWH